MSQSKGSEFSEKLVSEVFKKKSLLYDIYKTAIGEKGDFLTEENFKYPLTLVLGVASETIKSEKAEDFPIEAWNQIIDEQPELGPPEGHPDYEKLPPEVTDAIKKIDFDIIQASLKDKSRNNIQNMGGKLGLQ